MYALDFLRAFMMLLGILLHGFTFEPVIGSLSVEWSSRIFIVLETTIHAFRMPLFFCLSGYFSTLLFRKFGWRRFLLNRLFRIALPFGLAVVTVGFTTNFFYHILDLIANKGYRLTESFKTAFSFRLFHFSDVQPIHLWFLYYLSTFIPSILAAHYTLKRFLLMRRLKAVLNKQAVPKNRLLFIFLMAILPVVFFFITGHSEIPTPRRSFQLAVDSFIPYFYYFGFGWFLCYSKRSLKYFVPNASGFLLTGVALTLICLALSSNNFSGFSWIRMPLYALSVWFYIFGFLGVVQNYFNKPSALLQYVSDASYWIYLVHLPVIVFLKIFFIGSVSLSTFVLLLGATLYLCLLSYNYMVRPTLVGKLLNGKVQPAYPVHKFPVTRSLGQRVKRTVAQGYRSRYALLRP